MKLIKIVKNNFAYKLVALLLAATTYMYVQGEIGIKGIGISDRELTKDIVSKVVPVKVIVKGEPPAGYRILASSIKVNPDKVIIIGKKDDLSRISNIETQEIDIRKFTNTQSLSVSLMPAENAINISSKVVTVEIPIVSLH
ncbi:MAG: YbbR-like domain-containing protein [Candidatus Omnitrophica bacterium]|nr:YbbR-like domain-containing protein [Candidatus Omnitrophota bacterium]